ncbi:MAG: hypothetical protein M3O46_10115 [Myxococcota bacterium]|nr:hypothetical protein [Myxococcota bacterium]
MSRVSTWIWVTGFALIAAVDCKKTSRSSTEGEGGETESQVVAVAPMDAREAAQWKTAAQGDPEERMRLEDLVGCEGLRERASQANLRVTAIAAMQYCYDFSELPWLAGIAMDGPDTEARAALEAIDELAARRRRAADPEDADELHAGCGTLLALARSMSLPKERRVLAIRALRMLSERGCVRRADVPTDLDVK